jgi:sigma-E factor negative regulatory protein RseC
LNHVREQGRIVAIEEQKIWVESINRSACAQCTAKAVCGQSALARWAETANLLAIPHQKSNLSIGQTVHFQVDGDALVRAALTIYLLPLVLLLIGGALSYSVWPHDLVALAGALAGLIAGMKLAPWLAVKGTGASALGLALVAPE